MQAGPRPTRAVERDPAADGLHAVFEAGQASAPGEVGAADAVVADRDAKDFASDLDLDADGLGAGVLGRIGQRFSDEVIGADLYRLRQPPSRRYLQVDGDRVAAGECPESGMEAALGQDRGVDAARGLAQFLQRACGLADGAVELGSERGRRCSLCCAQAQGEGDQPLLGAVVQVALDPPTRLVGGGDDP